MYAGTKFNWIDNSYIQEEVATTEYDTRTLFFQLITADKGPEELIRVYGDSFYAYFGRSLSYDKHGQALLNCKQIIDNGGELLVKRFVADDATLSNVIVVANVTKKETQKTDGEGNPLYVDATTGEETTTETGNSPINITSAIIKYELQSVQNAKTFDDVYTAATELYNDENGIYPLIIATDIGRNADCKRLAITTDYDTSRSAGFMMYTFAEYENTVSEERTVITMNPNVTYRSRSYAINEHSMTYLKLGVIPNAYSKLAEKLAELSGVEYNTLLNADLLFGKTLRNLDIENITIDAEGADLSYQYGIELKNGSDGDGFGDTPKTSSALSNKMVDYLSGTVADEIYDVDVHKVAMIVDANYPLDVKEAIVKYVNFREDLMFLRDLGYGLTTFAEIRAMASSVTKSRYVADYMTTYHIYDPYTSRRVEVSMLHGMIPAIITKFQTAPASPMAGIINGFTITEAIRGTVNYIPRITPAVDQKAELEEARINYATYYEYDGPLVVDSLYTSQDIYSQLSYINNVIAIQEVMRAVRTECPRSRFLFITNDDFSEYQEAVENVLSNYRQYFNSLNMVYTQDPVKVAQKIFYASISFTFNNWAQAEVFDLYALNAEDVQ